MKLPPSYRDFTRNREWSPRMKNKIVSLNTIATRTRLNRSIFKADSLESNHLLFFSLKYQAYYYFLFIWNKKKRVLFSVYQFQRESNFSRRKLAGIKLHAQIHQSTMAKGLKSSSRLQFRLVGTGTEVDRIIGEQWCAFIFVSARVQMYLCIYAPLRRMRVIFK